MSALRSILAPRMWGAHLLMVVVVGAAIALGVWQYSNSAKAKDAQIDSLVHADPKALTDVMGGNDPFPGTDLGRPVVITGQWLPEGSIIIERTADETYWAATPVAVDGTESAIYVVRGATSGPDDEPEAPTGSTSLVAWLQPPEQEDMSDADPSDSVFPQLDVTQLLDRVDQDLFSAYAVSTAGSMQPPSGETINDGSQGLEPVEAPSPPEPDASTGLRNLLYAIEWWLFAVFGIYIWVRYVRDALRPEQDAENDAQEDAVPSTS